MSIAQYWLNFNDGCSGTKYFTEWAIQTYNVIYTSLPIIFLAVYDMDLSPKQIFSYPQLYKMCIKNEYFTSKLFWSWIATAMVESIFISVVPLYTLKNSQTGYGVLNTFWESGAVCYTVVVIVVNAKILFMQSNWHQFHVAIIILSFIMWFVVAFFITSFTWVDYDWYEVFLYLTGNPAFWLSIFFMATAIIAKDLFICAWKRYFCFNPVHILQEMQLIDYLRRDTTQNPMSKLLPNLDIEMISTTSEVEDH